MSQLELYDLTCEYRTNPLGLGELRPRLSWKLRTTRQGARQTAYRVCAARSRDAAEAKRELLWDSGKAESDQSVNVVYGGPALASGERVYWTVQVWDEAGNTASGSAWWEMGLLERKDWDPAQWIGGALVGGVWTTVPLPLLRREFALPQAPVRARLYVTALGLYECRLNGKRVGADRFTPGWTDYRQRVQYQVYDVTEQLQAGENVWGTLLGDGWYSGHLMLGGRQEYGDRPKLFGKLVVEYADGKRDAFVTDSHWQVKYGPLLGADNYNGESYDARLEQAGWDEPGFQGQGWLPVETFEDPGIALSAMQGGAVRDEQEIVPVPPPTEFKGFGGSRWVYDFGQNLVGRVRLKVSGAPGSTVRLLFAEVLNPDGTLYRTNLRGADQTDTYTLKGQGTEVWEPAFTFHGFRYVELQGYPEIPPPDLLTAIVMYSDTPVTGTFRCSDPLLNQLQSNIVWGQKSNFFDVPTDCPQRDERLGWLGDAQVFVRTSAFNMNVAAFFEKWLQDVADAQSERGAYPPVAPRPGHLLMDDGGPAWAEAGVIVPWTMYRVYDDERLLERQYTSMARFLNFLDATSEAGVRPAPGAPVWPGFGDWLALDVTNPDEGTVVGAWEGGTSKTLIGTAFFAHAARLMAAIARVLSKTDDAQKYDTQFERVRKAFQDAYVNADGSIKGNTQTGYILALHFDLLPEEQRAQAVDRLVGLIEARDMHLATGFVGTPYLNHVLTRGGRNDVAYALLQQQTYPSWLFPVLNGATTIWERWDGWTTERGFQDPAMNSFNHYAYGAIGDWIYTVVGGIDLDRQVPAYKHCLMQPQPGGTLTSAETTLETMYGKIESEWSRNGSGLHWRVVIPPNTSATVDVPLAEGQQVTQARANGNGHGDLTARAQLSNAARYELVAGEYTFRAA